MTFVRSIRRHVLAVLAGLLAPALAYAQTPPTFFVLCKGLTGCPDGRENTLFNNILPRAAEFGIKLAAGGAVVMIVIGGVRMLLSNGDEGKVGAAKKSIYMAFGGLALTLTSATIVGYVITENYGQNDPAGFVFGEGGLLASTVRLVLVLFNVAFVIVVMIAGLRMVLAAGEAGEFKKGGEVIKWAIVGAIVVNLARIVVGMFLNLDL